jgi:serine-type D-Ala-D-Ala carboxypeptidase (penicillin-binding protein 5/6)
VESARPTSAASPRTRARALRGRGPDVRTARPGTQNGPAPRPGSGVHVTEGLARLSQDPSKRRRTGRVTPKMRRRRLRASVILLVILIVVGLLASQGGSGSPSKSGGSQAVPTKPSLVLSMTSAHTMGVAGSDPVIPWTATGESAIAVPSAGLLVDSGPETSVPIASLTKMMTAYLTLLQHPLTATSSGPKLEMTEADQQEYDLDTTQDASSVYVQAGEVLTERQLLSALIVRSANNLADTLARWDAGNVPAFVARMNAEAAELGMTSTHYVDTNGLDAGSVSTAHDQLVLATKALQLPSFASLVDLTSVTMPFTGTLPNYVSAVGSDGVVGVKSGFTQAAMACVVLAAMRQVGNQQVLVLAADLGQPEGLDYAEQEDLNMINGVAPGLRLVTVAKSHEVVGELSVPGGGSHTRVHVETSSPLYAVGWPGSNVALTLTGDRMGQSVSSGAQVGFLDASSAGGPVASVPLIAVGSLHQ